MSLIDLFHKIYSFLKPLEDTKIAKFLKEKRLMRTLKFIDLKILDSEYILVITFFWLILFFLSLIVYIINYLIPFYPQLKLISITQLALAFLIMVLYYFPFYLASKKIYEIKKEFIYFLSHFKVLANSNLNFNEIISYFISSKDDLYPTIQKELYYAYKSSKIFNKSIESVLKERLKISPDNPLKKFLLSLINIKREKEEIKNFVNSYYDLENKRLLGEENKFFQKISLFSEVYLMILLILPFFFIIMSIIFDSINYSLGEFENFENSNFYRSILFLLIILPISYLIIYSILFKIMPPHLRKLSRK